MNGSGDLGDIIGKLTENPEMMKKLMGVANSLMNDQGDKHNGRYGDSDGYHDRMGVSEREHHENRRPSTHEKEEECERGDKHNGRGRRGDDAENLIRLLCALKPYVSPDRCSKIDNIVKILKLIQLSEKTGLLSSFL